MYKNRGGRPGPFYHVNDVSVYLGRQRGGGGFLIKRILCVCSFELGLVCFLLGKQLKLEQELQEKASSSFFWSVGKVGYEANQTHGQAEWVHGPSMNHTSLKKSGATFVWSYPLHVDETDVSSGADHFTVCKYRGGRSCDGRYRRTGFNCVV